MGVCVCVRVCVCARARACLFPKGKKGEGGLRVGSETDPHFGQGKGVTGKLSKSSTASARDCCTASGERPAFACAETGH